MKAMLLSEYKKLSIVDMPMPEVGPETCWCKSRHAESVAATSMVTTVRPVGAFHRL